MINAHLRADFLWGNNLRYLQHSLNGNFFDSFQHFFAERPQPAARECAKREQRIPREISTLQPLARGSRRFRHDFVFVSSRGFERRKQIRRNDSHFS